MANPSLSISIPTYNRAEFLDYSLSVHIPMSRRYGIEIIISDNLSTDDTEAVVDKWKKEYPLIKYYKNEANLGWDKNFELALKRPNTDFVWLLGDTYKIPKEALEYALNLIESQNTSIDVIIFNLADKLKNIKQKNAAALIYEDQNILLHDLGALMSCLSCLVFNRDLIQQANFEKYNGTSFIHTGVILEYISEHDFRVFLNRKLSIGSLDSIDLPKKNWSQSPDVFYIGCRQWTELIALLPKSFEEANKTKCIGDFGRLTKLFKIQNLLMLRFLGVLNSDVVRGYKQYFKRSIDYPYLVIKLISVIPIPLVKLIGLTYIFLFRKNKKQQVEKFLGMAKEVKR